MKKHFDRLTPLLLLPTLTTYLLSDGVISEIKKIWKCSDSYDSVFVKLMTALMTPIVDFHKLVTPLTTATLLHVKRALDYC